jgi:hypothetical protein
MTMTIDDLRHTLPSRQYLAHAIGLEVRSSATGDMLAAFGIFGTGMILGAGLALLFAPKAGHEMRQDIAETVGGFGARLRAQLPSESAPHTNGPSA